MPHLFLLLICFVILQSSGKQWFIQGVSEAEFNEADGNPIAELPIETNYQYLRNLSLKIYAMNYPPLMTIIGNPKTNRVKYEGLVVDFAEYITQNLELAIEYVPENSSDVANNGPNQAVINAVVKKEVDLALNGLTPTPERVKIMDMTPPMIYDDIKMMVLWPEEMDRWTEAVRPFDRATWCTIAVSFIVLIGAMSLMTIVDRSRHSNGIHNTALCVSGIIIRTVNAKIMYVVGIMTNQGQSDAPNRLFSRIMLAFWLLMMVVLINAYTGNLTSHLTIPKLEPIPQSLNELADMKDYKVTIAEGHILAKSFLNATSGVYKTLGDSLREHPSHLFKKYSEATDIVLKQNGASVESSTLISFRIAYDYKIHGKCRMTASKPISYVQSYSAALPKDSPYTKLVDKRTQRALETGLTKFWLKKHVPSMHRCALENQNSDGKPKPIRLIELSSAFAIIGIGLGLSVVAFLAEKIVSVFKKKIMSQTVIAI